MHPMAVCCSGGAASPTAPPALWQGLTGRGADGDDPGARASVHSITHYVTRSVPCVMCLQASPLLSCRQQRMHGCLGWGFPFITARTHSWALHTCRTHVHKCTRRLVNSFLSFATISYSPALETAAGHTRRNTHTVLCSALSKQLE